MDMKLINSNRKTMNRVLWSFAVGILYTVGFFAAFRMMWVDFTDKYLALESIIAYIGRALLCTLYAPVTFSRLYGSAWALPFLFVAGFIAAWLVLFLGSTGKEGVRILAAKVLNGIRPIRPGGMIVFGCFSVDRLGRL